MEIVPQDNVHLYCLEFFSRELLEAHFVFIGSSPISLIYSVLCSRSASSIGFCSSSVFSLFGVG